MADRIVDDSPFRTYKGPIDHDITHVGSWANVDVPECQNGIGTIPETSAEIIQGYTSKASRLKQSKIASKTSYQGYQMERWGKESKKEGSWTPAQVDLDER